MDICQWIQIWNVVWLFLVIQDWPYYASKIVAEEDARRFAKAKLVNQDINFFLKNFLISYVVL